MNKKIKIALGAVGGLLLVGGITMTVLTVMKTKESYELELANKDGQIATLNGQLDEIGEITTVYALNYDVKSGTIIMEQDVRQVDLPYKYTYDEVERPTGYLTDINNIIGQVYKVDLSKDTILAPSLITENELTDDLRYYDIVLDEAPIGVKAGDYIDIRIQFMLGQDFIALPHKQIVEINANTYKLYLSQEEIYTYQSMKTDRGYYPNVTIYGTQYIEGGVQEASGVYYPLRIETLATMVQDPNLGDDFDMSKYQHVDRDLLEEQLISKIESDNNDLSGKLVDMVKTNSDEYRKQYEKGLEYYNSVQETGSGTSPGGSSVEEPYVPVYN